MSRHSRIFLQLTCRPANKFHREFNRLLFQTGSKRSIAPSNSMWGRDYVLKPDERMIQYLIFAKEPLDVVFDSK